MAIRLVSALHGSLNVPLNDRRVVQSDSFELQTLSLGRLVLQTLPDPFEKVQIVREHNNLRAHLACIANLADRVILAEGILTVEGIVENNDLLGLVRVVLELSNEES